MTVADVRAGLPRSLDEETRRRVRTVADRRAVLEGYRYDQRRVDRFLRFGREFCCHSKGRWAGDPVVLEGWQIEEIIEPIFGWVHQDTGRRRCRSAYIEIGKKNGKSLLASTAGNYLAWGDGEPGAEVYTAAYARQQARIVYDEIARMVRASPHLRKRIKANRSTYRLSWEQMNCFIQALSKESEITEGINAHGILFDELHVQKDRRLWDALENAGAAREQPLLLAITTAGEDQTSICWEMHERTRKLHEGAIDDLAFYGRIWAVPTDADYSDTSVWHLANPNLGVTIDLDGMRADYESAKISPGGILNFRRRRLNQWVGGTEVWIDGNRWRACRDPEMPAIEDLVGCRAWLGVDLGSSEDLTAAVLLVLRDDGRWGWFPRYWCPEDVARERQRTNRGRFVAWSEAGYLTMTPGDTTDYAAVEAGILELVDRIGGVEMVGFDPYGAPDISQRVAAADIPTTLVKQGYWLSAPAKRFAVEVARRNVTHGGDPVSAWCIGNAVIESDFAERIRLNKAKSTGKIDGATAALNAMACYLEDEGEEQEIQPNIFGI